MEVHPRMSKAVASLIVSQPFYGTLACQLSLEASKQIPTFATDGKRILYNVKFLDSMDDKETLFVVAHEVLHCALFHHTRRGKRDPKLWNIAADYVINATLKAARIGTMPSCGLYDPKYADWAAEEVYRDLEKQAAQQPTKGNPGQSGKVGTESQPGSGEPQEGDEAGEGEGNPIPGSDDPGGCGAILDAAEDDGGIAEAESEWQTVVRQAVNIATKQHGSIPKNLRGLVEELKKPKVDWREVLRRFVDPSSRYDYSWCIPDRRFGGAPYILPGMVTDGINHIAVVVDTSGSIDRAALQRFGGELQGLADQGVIDKLTVVYSDCAVQRTETFEHDEPFRFEPPVGGGTAFGPGINWVAENEPDVTAAIYFTDLDGGFGSEPHFPVLWAVYGAPNTLAHKTAPFGEVIPIVD